MNEMTIIDRIVSFFASPRPVNTSLRSGILFVLQSSHSPMDATDIAAETHAGIDDVNQTLDQLLTEERVRCSWSSNSPFRVYSIIRKTT